MHAIFAFAISAHFTRNPNTKCVACAWCGRNLKRSASIFHRIKSNDNPKMRGKSQCCRENHPNNGVHILCCPSKASIDACICCATIMRTDIVQFVQTFMRFVRFAQSCQSKNSIPDSELGHTDIRRSLNNCFAKNHHDNLECFFLCSVKRDRFHLVDTCVVSLRSWKANRCGCRTIPQHAHTHTHTLTKS